MYLRMEKNIVSLFYINFCASFLADFNVRHNFSVTYPVDEITYEKIVCPTYSPNENFTLKGFVKINDSVSLKSSSLSSSDAIIAGL